MRRFAILFLFTFSVCCVVPSLARADDIVLGEYGSMTGGTATFGTSTDEGVRLGWIRSMRLGAFWVARFGSSWKTTSLSPRRR